MKSKKRFRSAALQHAHDRFVGDDPKRVRAFEDELVNAGNCRLEDADYQGHSLSMLRRIAEALDKRLEIRFIENNPEAKSA